MRITSPSLILLAAAVAILPTTNATKINPSFPVGNHTRNNFCSLLSKIGRVSLQTILTGMTLYVAVEPGTQPFEMKVNQTTGQPTGGFSYSLQQAIAATGGFKFKYIPVPNRPAGVNITTWLLQIAPFVDLFADSQYSDTTDRRAQGLAFTVGFEDASAVLVTTVITAQPQLQIFNFATPFSNALWLLICMTIVFNAFFSWLLHIYDPDTRCSNKIGKLIDTFFRTIYSFTNTSWNESKTVSTRLLNIGYFCLLVIIVASYTATLASVLFSTPVSIPTVESMSDAQAHHASICASAGSAEMQILQTYPGIVPVPIVGIDASRVLRSVVDGVCQAAIVTKADYDLYSNNAYANPDCNLQISGPTLLQINGAWPFVAAFSPPYCTSVMETTISAIITAKKADGSLATLYKSAVAAAGNANCVVSSSNNGAQAFDLTGYSGIICIYAIIAAMCWSLFGFMYIRKVVQIRMLPPNHEAVAHSQKAEISRLLQSMKVIEGRNISNAARSRSTAYLAQAGNIESTADVIHELERGSERGQDQDIDEHIEIVKKLSNVDESFRPPCEEMFRTGSCSSGDLICPYAHSTNAMHKKWREESTKLKAMIDQLTQNHWNPDPALS